MKKTCGIVNLIFAAIVLFMTIQSTHSALNIERVMKDHEATEGMQNDYFMLTPPSATQSVVGFLVAGIMIWSGIILLKRKV